MENLEYSGLMHPNVEWKNAAGKVFFSMKKKEDWGPTYYVFEINRDILSDNEQSKFEECWEIICHSAGLMNILLFDSQEIMDAVETQIKNVMISEDAKRAIAEADDTGERVLVRDIDISLFDHGTREITSLTIGISVLAGSSESIKKMFNDG